MPTQSSIQEALRDVLSAYPQDKRFALAAMQDMQRRFGYIPRDGLTALAAHLNCRAARLYAIATFYRALSLNPKGKHIIKICDGTTCHIRGSFNLVEGISRELCISPGETSEDGEFSLELVNCIGSCAIAPAMLIDGVYYGKVTPDKLQGILETVRKEPPA